MESTKELTAQLHKEAKHRFFLFRNGAVAQALVKAFPQYKTVLGLQLPQISAIAKELKEMGRHNDIAIAELRENLWNEIHTRESRLLAIYLAQPDKTSIADAMKLVNGIHTKEEADILCFRLLRNMKEPTAMLPHMETSEAPFANYCHIALKRNLNNQ